MIETRPLTIDDLEIVLDLQRRSNAFDGVQEVLELEELAEELDDEHVVLATDTRLALEDGVPVGYAYTYWLPSEVREERCYVFGAVAPQHRGRGAGRALMAFGIERAEEQLRSSGRDLPCFIRTDALDGAEAALRLYARMGMVPVRYNDELLRPLTDLPQLPTPHGFRVVPWPAERSEEIRTVKNAAFADHWGSTPTSEHHWEQMTTGYGARLDLSFVALDDDGAVVGHCLCKRFEADDELIGRSDGWVDSLGTLREWRGRGVASGLIAHALHAFAAAGLTHASIGVDSENPTGAARLYRGLGFEPRTRRITYEIALPQRTS